MSDDLNNETEDNEEESFAELFESYSFGMKDDLQIGDKVDRKDHFHRKKYRFYGDGNKN